MPNETTTWLTKALCISKSKGIGLSEIVELNVSKLFYIDILTPYSIKRNVEIMYPSVTIFNNYNHSILVRLSFGDKGGMQLVNEKDVKTTNVCIEASNSFSHIYKIKGLRIGDFNISASVELNPPHSINCGNEKLESIKQDLVYKTVKVEAEGYPNNIVHSTLLCTDGSLGKNNISWSIDLPEGVINDTIFGTVTINSNVFESIIEDLDNYLYCFKCKLHYFSSLQSWIECSLIDLYRMRYLNSRNALNKDLKTEILKDMELYYQAILGYSHKTGSFSEFRTVNKEEGSMYYTTLVVRTLRLMKDYIHINDEVVDNAVNWILAKLNVYKCLKYRTSNSFNRGEFANEYLSSALTSFIVISLKESNVKIPDNVYTKTTNCFSELFQANNYTLAISSYALSLINSELAEANIKSLLKSADNDNGKIFWQNNDVWSMSNAIEITGYALLSLLQNINFENIRYINALMRYLKVEINQVKTNDVKISCTTFTQDWLVALDGMTRIPNIFYKNNLNLDINVYTTLNGHHNIKLKEMINQSKKDISLYNYPESINVQLKGYGCVLGQVAVKFNTNKNLKTDALKLKVFTKSATNKNQCIFLNITSCVIYDNEVVYSKMALLEISMPSGYVPDQYSLYSIKDITKFELMENTVVLYFNKLKSGVTCFSFLMEEIVVVKKRVDSVVKFFYYYAPAHSVSQTYKVPVCN